MSKASLLAAAIKLQEHAAAKLLPKIDLQEAARALAESDSSLSLSAEDYNSWMGVIEDLAKERGIKLSHMRAFHNLAYEVLDDDSRIDELGANNETAKQHIVNALYRGFQAQEAHKKADDHVTRTQRHKRLGISDSEEEELSADELFSREQSIAQSGFKVGAEHLTAGKGHRGTVSNPYATGTNRYKWFAQGYDLGYSGEHGPYDNPSNQPASTDNTPVKVPSSLDSPDEQLPSNVKPANLPPQAAAYDEEEAGGISSAAPSIDGIGAASADQTGFMFAASCAAKGSFPAVVNNPHSEDSVEYVDWNKGYSRFKQKWDAINKPGAEKSIPIKRLDNSLL